MSLHTAFRRQPVPGEMGLRHATTTLPAPIRGIIEVENWAYTKPGCATILDNWFPTQRGLKLRGGTERWLTLPDPVEIVRSGFDYVSGNVYRMFAATSTRLFDVSFADNPVLQTGVGTIADGNFSTTQFATEGGDWLLAVNDVGDYVRRFNGTIWEYLNTAYAGTPSRITAPVTAPAAIQDGRGLTYVWKYRNRLFFIQGGTMNAWCLPVNAVGGELIHIPLSGAAKKGGSLLFGASWSMDAGDSGSDDKCVFMTDQGEILVFTGTDPATVTNWKQEGRYDISKPMGKNGHQQLGGDVLILTIDGIVPLSAATQKDVSALSLAAITYNIEPTWMRELKTKDALPWTLAKWDEGNALFVTWPGGKTPATKVVGVSNLHTGAWSRYVGWDATCFLQMRGSLFFGTQTGTIMQVDSTGNDDGVPYICRMVGGWEMFQVPPSQVTWLQARAAFFSSAREPFEPQLAATTDYEFRIPPAPSAGPDPGLLEVWDQGLWDQARWDQPGAGPAPVKNTMWVSIGETGFSHAPICQVTVDQQAKPDVELVSISATFVRMAANV